MPGAALRPARHPDRHPHRKHLLHTPDGRTQLRLGQTDLDLLPPLDHLINQLPLRPPSGIAGQLHQAPWLFPGKKPDRPLHHTSLARRLTAIGVDPRPDRNSALLEYARQLPPPVIGKLLGLHPGTTDHWASIAGGKWARYTPGNRGR
ncbi:hypothetical protein SAMN06265355_113174 [Actinomadura mexicana]|uniref:Uncharacterized protein n=1 Tax=Actinomadura mexicana TaxID=134959 RepID=A0A239CZU0_9ACTN|nr:hypothetical protein SAMN06265355_113174 [Actinomadura mexicana]